MNRAYKHGNKQKATGTPIALLLKNHFAEKLFLRHKGVGHGDEENAPDHIAQRDR